MKLAIAKTAFRRSDTGERVKRGQRIEGENAYIDELQKLGHVMGVKAVPGPPERTVHPRQAAGATRPSSASQAARASRQTTANESTPGAKPARKKRGE